MSYNTPTGTSTGKLLVSLLRKMKSRPGCSVLWMKSSARCQGSVDDDVNDCLAMPIGCVTHMIMKTTALTCAPERREGGSMLPSSISRIAKPNESRMSSELCALRVRTVAHNDSHELNGARAFSESN